MTVRIAMWSGPRNLSTAMMRSFSSRPDTIVSDEPFYGCYLKQTGDPQPMAEQIIASMDCDWSSVARTLTAPAPGTAPVWYQKHMVHHMVGPVDYDDLRGLKHAFLIREPQRVVASYFAKREEIRSEHLGSARQLEFFEREADRIGHAPPVVDSADLLRDPAGVLKLLCEALGISWTDQMLSWAPGPHSCDGIWGAHWYDTVNSSCGFKASDERPLSLPPDAQAVADACRPYYEKLARYRLHCGV
ncbi:MAG TPA: HAD family hydrolase [Sphingomicrobium sp.]|nr:HAD family hydrolase [Sphingomicrobium sp.]